ncbi:farnesol dehydrogenase [Leptinotarsa decemlineata]|uniref:farnesol dehydrogenase n=1 Tax=Leptinotarsa decemlineata TaxID=7539 RepID=UPI000C253DE2|nr:farnesol dehydrogenase-like [Leptinotarsa decemlineata]
MVLSMDRWKGKVAIVTGASSGIGAAIARRLVEEGLQVVGLARRKDRLEDLSKLVSDKPGKLYSIQTDISNEDDILKAFEWTKRNLGPVHILVNNAGTNVTGSLLDGSTENWNKIFQLNVLGLSITTREAIKQMNQSNIDGHIIHINSVSGHQPIRIPRLGMYMASKHSVTSLTESLRYELALSGSKVKVTSISPGLVDTEMISNRNTEVIKKIIEDKIILNPDDIVDGLIYVLSTPPHVQVHELMIRPVGELYG